MIRLITLCQLVFHIWSAIALDFRNDSCASQDINLVYETDGDAIISLLLQEKTCLEEVTSNELASTAIYLLQKLNENEYVKGVKIGTCSYDIKHGMCNR